MSRDASDTQAVARNGRALVTQELERRGAKVLATGGAPIRYLAVSTPGSRRPVRVRVKTRQSGTWQAQASDGNAASVAPPTPTFWVFVDASQHPPQFFIASDEEVRRDIYEHHQLYLARHGGHRAENDASNHHAIRLERVAPWKDRWHLLGLDSSPTGTG